MQRQQRPGKINEHCLLTGAALGGIATVVIMMQPMGDVLALFPFAAGLTFLKLWATWRWMPPKADLFEHGYRQGYLDATHDVWGQEPYPAGAAGNVVRIGRPRGAAERIAAKVRPRQ